MPLAATKSKKCFFEHKCDKKCQNVNNFGVISKGLISAIIMLKMEFLSQNGS